MSARWFRALVVFLCAAGSARLGDGWKKPAAVVAAGCVAAALLWRLFPDPGRFPFPSGELLAALTFCAIGIGLSWNVEHARVLRMLFATYAVLCLVAYFVPSDIGANVARLRFAAIPIAALTLSLRRWRPWPIAVIALEDSRMESRSRCSGRISVTFSATRRLSGLMATPCAFNFTTSSRNACGSNTTPLPITASFDGRSTPEGNSASL